MCHTIRIQTRDGKRLAFDHEDAISWISQPIDGHVLVYVADEDTADTVIAVCHSHEEANAIRCQINDLEAGALFVLPEAPCCSDPP